MAIHVFVARAVLLEQPARAAGHLHVADQVLEAPMNRVAEFALFVSVAGPQKRQQGKTRRAHTTPLVARVCKATTTIAMRVIETPTAVAVLVRGQPVECRLDGPFGNRRWAAWLAQPLVPSCLSSVRRPLGDINERPIEHSRSAIVRVMDRWEPLVGRKRIDGRFQIFVFDFDRDDFADGFGRQFRDGRLNQGLVVGRLQIDAGFGFGGSDREFSR